MHLYPQTGQGTAIGRCEGASDASLKHLAGIASTLAPANRRALANLGIQVHATNSLGCRPNNLDPAFETLLIDPQTCGPLLISVAPEIAEALLDHHPDCWWSIGTASLA